MPAVRIAISSFFTAEPVAEPLAFLFGLLGWPVEVQFAPFGQVFQTLLDSNGLFARTPDGIHIVLARAEDVENSLDAFTDALISPSQDVMVQICAPHSDAMEQELRARLLSRPRVSILSGNDLERLYPVSESLDPRARELGAIPYSPEYFAALAAHLARSIHQRYPNPCKAIALDCDDTLWRGVCGEDGPDGVSLDPPRRALQQFMQAQRAGGRMLAIASKNNAADVVETFRRHPEFPLDLNDFAARQIHWEAKSSSLGSIAAVLNIGIDSIAFVDNDAREIEEVAAQLPGVITVALPAELAQIPAFLNHMWAFDAPQTLTTEDLTRAQSYTSEARRASEAQHARSLEEFISGLELKIVIAPIEDHQISRVTQLTQRTNQMNTTTRRRSEADIRAFLQGGIGLAVKVRDRLGDYGLVGVMLLLEGDSELIVESLMLSCRALGRGVEQRMLRRVGEMAIERRIPSVRVEFESTAKNVPARDLLTSIADGDGPFVFPSDELARLQYRPSDSRPPVTNPTHREVDPPRATNYQRIAELRAPADLLAVVTAQRADGAQERVTYKAPHTDLERRLSSLWTELLGVPHIGANENFFDLGGHSLLAVQLVSRLHQELAIDLPLEAVYTGALTISELARSIEVFELGNVDDPEYAAQLSEIEKLSEEEVEALLASEIASVNAVE